MKWYWFILLIPIGLIVLLATDKPIGIYHTAELEYDKASNSYFVVIDGQEIDVIDLDKTDEAEIYAGMTVYCLQASRDSWIKIWEYFFSLTDVDPDKWLEEIYPDATSGRGGAIFICILSFLAVLIVLCSEPKKMIVIHADSD